MNLFKSPERAEGYFQDFERSFCRYVFASRFLDKNKIVLDVASGSGYGTKFLAKKVKRIYGVEIDKDAYEYSQVNFSAENIVYKNDDANNMGLASDSIDLVISFETIEHISDYHFFLKEIKRILRKDGLLVISTPNKLVNSPRLKKPLHDFHVKEWDIFEFKALLQKYFFVDKIYVQKFSWPYFVVKLRDLYAWFFSFFGEAVLRFALKILQFLIFRVFMSLKKSSLEISPKVINDLDTRKYKKSFYFPKEWKADEEKFAIQIFVLKNKK